MIGPFFALVVLACNNAGQCSKVILNTYDSIEECQAAVDEGRIFNAECLPVAELVQMNEKIFLSQ